MPTADLLNQNKEKIADLKLSDEVFGAEVKDHLFYEIIKQELANKRSGTASTKTRAMVSGGGKKPWRQKGTGRARVGSIRSPLWKGGGIVFGPHPRDYYYSVPKKMKRGALKSALASKLRDGKLLIIDQITLPEAKTKQMVNIFKGLGVKKPLILIEARNEILERSVRNIPGAKVLSTQRVNLFDILAHEELIITKAAVQNLEDMLSHGKLL